MANAAKGCTIRQRIFATVAANALIATAFLGAASTASAQGYRERLPEDEVVYFVLPDRFANGDPRNDRGGIKGTRLDHGFDPTSKGFYQGGDLKGLTARLDYIQNLGATAVWLSPIFKNKPVQGAPGQESAGYHGYWITDFTQVDPHLGTRAEMKAFVEAAHARGMKVYLDIIPNHTADVIKYRECPKNDCAYRSKADYPGNPAYTPYLPKGEEKAKAPAWLNDPTYYHNRGDSTFRGESSLYGDFSGLDDLFTEHPRVVQGFIDIYGAWIDEFGIDGFRIDTARHVNPEFWQAFVPAMLARAKARGIPNFHIFAEVYDPDPATLARFTRVDRIPSTLDFAFQSAATDVVTGKAGTDRLARLFQADAVYEGGEMAALRLPTFLGNHDMGRFARFVREARPEASDAEVLRRVTLGHALMFFTRGVPVLYYGDEQGFAGDGGDQDARETLFASKVARYTDNTLVGTDATHAADNFNPDHPLYRAIAEMASLRQRYPALRRGAQTVRAESETPGLFALSRRDSSGGEILIAFNTGDTPLTARVVIDAAARTWTGLRGQCTPAASAPGSYVVSIQPLDYVICASGALEENK